MTAWYRKACKPRPAVVAMVLVLLPAALAHDIITTKLTYSRDISRILARHCVSCHAAGAAIPLSSYKEVRPWAVAIKEQVLTRSMPPWGAVKGFGDFVPDYGLNEEEIQLIAAWVVGGAPQGDERLLPAPDPPRNAQPARTLTPILDISTRTILKKAVVVAGIRPRPEKTVNSIRITARFPNGRIEPLLWLYGYNPEWNRVFRFRQPLALPRGTVVEATGALQYSIEALSTGPSREQ